MAETITIARPYAKAAFQAAKDKDALTIWSDMLAYASVVASDENMRVVLDHPALTSEQKAQLFTDVCGDKLTTEAKNFVFVLSEHNRLALVPDIADLFENFKTRLEKSIDVEVESAFELGKEQQNKLAQALSTKLDRNVVITSTVDETLLGGAIIRAHDLVIDASVRGKIAKLTKALTA